MSSDDSLDEGSLRYGTPLEEYDEEDLPRKKSAFQDIREQFAVDSHGKRRFHGAFTGGFTAGYGNTVAAPEGFTPANFKSSRSERHQDAALKKPEDFMDEEDRSEFGIAPKLIQPSTQFSGHKRKKDTQFHDGPIPGAPVLENILQQTHETAAVRILKSMGWRPGKGVGEKVTARERDKTKKIYTCFIPEHLRPRVETENKSKSSSDSDEDDIYSDLLFEPCDFEAYVAKPKTDVFGLGYSGLSRHSVLGSLSSFDTGDGSWKGSHLVTMDNGRKVSIRGQAFGVGALEEDDEDIYAKEDMSNYDFTLGASSTSLDNAKKKEKGKNAVGSLKKVLEGFVPASKSSYSVKVFPPPALPRDFVPTPLQSSRFSSTILGSDEIPQIRDRTLGRHDLSARHRGQMLGEEFIEPEISTNTGIKTHSEYTITEAAESRVDCVGDKEEIGGSQTPMFKPFSINTDKQIRYENFMSLKDRGMSDSDCAKVAGARGMSNWEVSRELREFEQAYKLYRPLTGLMSDRFTSATRTDDENSAVQKNREIDISKYTTSDKIEAARLGMFGKLTREKVRWIPDSLLCKRFNIPEPYNGGYANQTKEKKKPSYSIFEYLEAPAHDKKSYIDSQNNLGVKNQQVPIPSTSKNNVSHPLREEEGIKEGSQNNPKSKRLTTVELFLQEKEKEKEETLKKLQSESRSQIHEKKDTTAEEISQTIDSFNKIDLYKAVFLSDSEDSEKDEENKTSKKEVKEIAKIRISRFDSSPKNVERNESPPRGIFANLNFDRLNSWQTSSTRNVDDSLTTKSVIEANSKDNASKKDDIMAVDKTNLNIDNQYYGPALPDKHIFKSSSERSDVRKDDGIVVDSSNSSDDDSDDWVELKDKNDMKSKKAKSKKKKDKKDKKKGKHKYKEKKHKKKKHKIKK